MVLVEEHIYDSKHHLALDLYLPDVRPPRPPALILFIHGGAWVQRTKAEFVNAGRALAALPNVAAAVIDYRLSPAELSSQIHPMHTTDCNAALAWLHENASGKYDPSAIFLCGHSAGGFMSGLIAQHPPYLQTFRPPLELGVRGIIGIQGIYDLPALDRSFPDYHKYFLDAAFGTDKAFWRESSPAHTPFSPLSAKVPWCIVHSLEDELVDPLQCEIWEKRLTQHGVPFESHKPAGWGKHWDGVFNMGTPQDVLTPVIADFVRRTTMGS